MRGILRLIYRAIVRILCVSALMSDDTRIYGNESVISDSRVCPVNGVCVWIWMRSAAAYSAWMPSESRLRLRRERQLSVGF